jgi:hypothetical protein
MRHPSVRGLGARYLIAVLLPISGAALVIYTAIELAIAHATHSVPPPRRIAEASLPDNFTIPGATEPEPGTSSPPAPGASSQPAPAENPAAR